MFTNTQIHHFRNYGYTTASTLFNATEVRAIRAELRGWAATSPQQRLPKEV